MYPLIHKKHNKSAGKITGMLLEAMDITELLNLLEDGAALDAKIREACGVLEDHQKNSGPQ